MMILALGDIVGRSGRDAVKQLLPTLQEKYKPDVLVINAENAANGFGITEKIARELFSLGVDALTLGNHTFDNPDGRAIIESDHRILRPINGSVLQGGRGESRMTIRGFVVQVVSVSGRVGMAPMWGCPFESLDSIIPASGTPKSHGLDAILVDVHAEATSEKASLAYYLSGRVSVVWGTHTHVPTADTRILDPGTAFQTDLGMTGDYHSVIGMRPDTVIPRMRGVIPKPRMEVATGSGSVCGILVRTDNKTGLATRAAMVRIGGCLPPILPELATLT